MASFSRRALARYATNQILNGVPAKKVGQSLSAALVTSGKAHQADQLMDDIKQEFEDRGILASAVATSARPLSANVKSSLKAQLKKVAKVKEVSLSEVLDTSVLGGVRIETANHTWDETIAAKLAEIKGGL